MANFAGGTGSESNPYEIETWNHLDSVRSASNDHFVLTDDLGQGTDGYDEHASGNANGGDGWNPIDFDGTFDGAGHSISDLFVARTGTGDYSIGLFGEAQTSTVENLALVDVAVTGLQQVGALAGIAGDVSNCSATGSVEAADQYQASTAGGLVGSQRGTMTDSQAAVAVTGDITIGGLVGINRGTIERSHATGDVTGNMSHLGGLVGDNQGDVVESWATGAVAGVDVGHTVTGVGGLVGKNTGGFVEKSYARGDATHSGSDPEANVGGLIGENVQDGEVRNVYASGNADGYLANVGGVAGLNEGTVIDAYYNSDLNGSGFGEIDEGSGNVSGLSAAQMQGDAAASNMTWLDFASTWTTVDGDFPVLQEDGGGGDPDPLSVTADGDSIGVGGDAAISIDAASVAKITVSDLWTDWAVTDVTDEGGTVTDEIDTAGTYTIDWSSQQGSVSPAITVSPPDRYVGGEYAIVVTATDGEDTVDATATLQID